MAVKVTIKEKGLIKKERKINDFIFENMGYGAIDGSCCLVENQTGKVTIVYSKEQLERGIEIFIEKGKVNLRMPLPTGENEIIFFYDYIKKICKLFHTKTFEREGVLSTFDQIDEYIKQDKEATTRALMNMEEDLKTGNYYSISVYAVYNPIALSLEDLIMIKQSPKKLGQFLQEKQSIDAYYGGFKIYQKPNGEAFAIYTLTEKVLSIFPFKNNIFVGDRKVENIYLSFIYENEMKGIISYENFLDHVDTTDLYDIDHFLIELNKEQMEDLLNQYKVEIEQK